MINDLGGGREDLVNFALKQKWFVRPNGEHLEGRSLFLFIKKTSLSSVAPLTCGARTLQSTMFVDFDTHGARQKSDVV